jgi:hypothetical protein
MNFFTPQALVVSSRSPAFAENGVYGGRIFQTISCH